jgi:hypothetical protein
MRRRSGALFRECVDDAKMHFRRLVDREARRREAWGDLGTGAEGIVARLPQDELPFSLRNTLLYLCRVGSIAYNLRLPDAGDEDLVAVVLPPASHVLGLDVWEQHAIETPRLDVKCFSLRRFMSMLVEGDPAALETIWVRPEHRLYVSNLFECVLETPSRFNSRRAVCGLASRSAAHLARHREAQDDTTRFKAAHHALRTARMAVELARTGELTVFREADAQELKAIKTGRFNADAVCGEVERLLAEVLELKDCRLPETPHAPADYQLVDIALQAWSTSEDATFFRRR